MVEINRKDLKLRCFLVELLREFVDFDPDSSVSIVIRGQQGKYIQIMELIEDEIRLTGIFNGLKVSMGRLSNLREFICTLGETLVIEEELEEVLFEYINYLGEKRLKVENIEKFRKPYELLEGYFRHNCRIVPTPAVYLDDYPEEYLIEDLIRSISDDL